MISDLLTRAATLSGRPSADNKGRRDCGPDRRPLVSGSVGMGHRTTPRPPPPGSHRALCTGGQCCVSEGALLSLLPPSFLVTHCAWLWDTRVTAAARESGFSDPPLPPARAGDTQASLIRPLPETSAPARAALFGSPSPKPSKERGHLEVSGPPGALINPSIPAQGGRSSPHTGAALVLKQAPEPEQLRWSRPLGDLGL